MVTVEVDTDMCIGCGMCVGVCPAVFTQNEEGKSTVKEGADLSLDCVSEARDNCPVGAITVSE